MSRLQVGGKTNQHEQNETMRTRPVQPASGLLAATSGNFRARTPVKDTALAVRDAVFMNFNFFFFLILACLGLGFGSVDMLPFVSMEKPLASQMKCSREIEVISIPTFVLPDKPTGERKGTK